MDIEKANKAVKNAYIGGIGWGNIEYLATNLPMEEFNTSEIVYLYRLRWEIETAYDVLKNKFFIENFTGTKPLL